jgi:hypothetical protein
MKLRRTSIIIQIIKTIFVPNNLSISPRSIISTHAQIPKNTRLKVVMKGTGNKVGVLFVLTNSASLILTKYGDIKKICLKYMQIIIKFFFYVDVFFLLQDTLIILSKNIFIVCSLNVVIYFC